MSEFVLKRETDGVSSGFVGTVACWVAGLSLSVAAVSFSVSSGLQTKILGLVVLLLGAMLCGAARTLSTSWKLRLSAMMISLCLMLLVAEGLLRLTTHFPINTTSHMVPHPELGYVMDPEVADIDANGFRNAAVVPQADLVAIGDSHTQGFNAESPEAWPQQLGRHLKQSVYSMSVGGYGPIQYRILINDALALSPRRVVVGLYLGNDFADVRRGIRSRHSKREIENRFRYGLKYHTAVGSAVTQLLKRSRLGRPAGFMVASPAGDTYVSEARCRYLVKDMNIQNAEIRKAVSQTMRSLDDMNQLCAGQNVEFSVLLIPTRETVYAQANRELEVPPLLKLVCDTENSLRTFVMNQLDVHGVRSIDVLPDLVAAIKTSSSSPLYAAHDDGHPLPAGYAVYASAAAENLK